MSDQERISPYNINTISSIEVTKYQILQTDMIRIVCQTLKRITSEIFGVKGIGKTLSALGK